MTKRRVHYVGDEDGHASLAESMFAEVVRNRLKKLRTRLAARTSIEAVATRILNFLDGAARPVPVRIRGKLSMAPCLDIIEGERNLTVANPEDWSNIVLDFWGRPDFRVLQGMLFELREEAEELGLRRKHVEPMLRRILKGLLPDQRPEKVQKGEFCEGVISELKQIRKHRREFRSFEELERQCLDFEVVRILGISTFDSEDRDLLASPNRWGYLVTYGTGILKKYFKVESDHTIRQYRKEYKAYLKSSARTAPQSS